MAAHISSVKALSVMFIVYGAIHLFGYSNFEDIKLLSSGLPGFAVYGIYVFGITYGIMGILCGTRMMRREDWARKTALSLTFASLVIGLMMTPVGLKNLGLLYAKNAGQYDVTLDDLRKSYILFGAMFTAFEIFFIYFFTRRDILGYFIRDEQ
ncbi:MAG: hypothetical protein ABH885_04300 [Candidatus Omnitrophota bacterium]